MSAANLTPTATDALRRWVVHAGFSIRRRDAVLAALDEFDAALGGEMPDAQSPALGCRWSESRQRWESVIRPEVSKDACGHVHVAGVLGASIAKGSRGANLIRFHLQSCDIADDDRADLAALADHLDAKDDDAAAVWRFARDFARTSGDSSGCQCVACRAYRAVQDDEGTTDE